jgi:hypothetical protein
VLVSTGLVLLVFPLVQGRELGWPAWIFGMLAASVPVLALFGLHQVRRRRAGRSPLVEPALFRSRAFTGGMVVGLFFFGGLIGFSLALGLHLQLALGFTPLQSGLAQAPWALGMALGAGLSGAVLGRRFGRPVIQVGSLVVAAGLVGLVLTLSGGAVTGWQLAPALLVCGFGSGLLVAPFFDIVLAGVSLPMVGSASGVLNANQQLGGAAGVAVLGTVYFQLLDAGDAPGAARAVLWTTVGLMLAAGALAGLLPRHARPEDAAA